MGETQYIVSRFIRFSYRDYEWNSTFCQLHRHVWLNMSTFVSFNLFFFILHWKLLISTYHKKPYFIGNYICAAVLLQFKTRLSDAGSSSTTPLPVEPVAFYPYMSKPEPTPSYHHAIILTCWNPTFEMVTINILSLLHLQGRGYRATFMQWLRKGYSSLTYPKLKQIIFGNCAVFCK